MPEVMEGAPRRREWRETSAARARRAREPMTDAPAAELRRSILEAWRTNNRVTVFFVQSLPEELWGREAPGGRRSVR